VPEKLPPRELRKIVSDKPKKMHEEKLKSKKDVFKTKLRLRGKKKIDDQRRQAEELLKNKRDAIARAESERQQKMQEMHNEIQKARDAQMAQMALDKANRERIERLRIEVESGVSQRVATSASKQPVSRAAAPTPVRRPVGDQAGAKGAGFAPESFLAHQIFGAYCSRNPPDEKLPVVTLTKRSEGLFFLGTRKCQIQDESGVLYVKQGEKYEEFVTWLEKNERTEALRAKGLKSAQTVFAFQRGAF